MHIFSVITQNNGNYAVQVIPSHRFWYHMKVRMRYEIATSNNQPS